MPRPTVHDIARNAGVSLATVDRVLNNRPGVRAGTIERVHEVIDKIGYVRDVAAANLARQKDHEFVFVVPDGHNSFFKKLMDVILEAKCRAEADRINLSILRVPPNDPHVLASLLEQLDFETTDGIAIMAPETPQVRDAIRKLKERGLSVVAIISDLPNSDADQFVGINNIAAGRTAGLLLGSFLVAEKSHVLVVAGSMLAHDHAERRLGFDQIMAEKFPCLRVLPTIEAWDDAKEVEALLSNALVNYPDVKGIYSIGGGNLGLADVLRRRLGPKIKVVAHDVTTVCRQALIDEVFDAVIEQDLGHIVRSAVRIMKASCDRLDVIPSQEKIRIEVVLKENLI